MAAARRAADQLEITTSQRGAPEKRIKAMGIFTI
jgi:hypothetical protein